VVPEEARALYRRGLESAEAGELGRAFDLLERAVQLHPDFAEACKTLARISAETNEIRAFQNWCHEAARIDPADPEPYWMLGDWLGRKGRKEEALEALRRSLSMGPLSEEMRHRIEARLRDVERHGC
jgi:cytochrome c-type biogenesis protein CcmH/NrfG